MLIGMDGTGMKHELVRLPPAPGGQIDVLAIEEAVRDWVCHPAFTALVGSFGGPRQQTDLASYLEALERFSTVWDFRGGQERNLARSLKASKEGEEQIFATARILGMREGFERPRADEYDHCLILGGLVRACVIRPAWAAELAKTGIRFGDVTALGGVRPLGGDEPSIASAVAMSDVVDEFQAMDAGLRRAFGVAGDPVADGKNDPSEPNGSWIVHRYQLKDLPLSVVAAPSSQPHLRRANTGDSYAWWAKNVAKLTADHRILLVTSAIYVPFQHADAVRMLAAAYDCAVETVGVPAGWTIDGVPKQWYTAANYLQEMRSAICSMRLLMDHLRKA